MALLTNNRFVLGVGHGQDRLADMIGVPRSTRPIMQRYMETLRALWRGERVSAKNDGWILNDATLGAPLDEIPPIYVGAVGDATLAWAGRHADGVILFSCLTAEAVAHSVDVVRHAAETAGRDPASVEIWGVAVTACEVSEEKFLNYVVRRMNTYFMLPMIDALIKVNGWNPKRAAGIRSAVFEQARKNQGTLGDEGVSRELETLREFRDLYATEWIEKTNAIGDADTACRFVRSLFDAGANRVLIHGSPPADIETMLSRWSKYRPTP